MIFSSYNKIKRRLEKKLIKLENNPVYRVNAAADMDLRIGEISDPDYENIFKKIRNSVCDIQNRYEVKGVFDINSDSFLIVVLYNENPIDSFAKSIRILSYKIISIEKESKIKVYTYCYEDSKEMNYYIGFYNEIQKLLFSSKEQDKNIIDKKKQILYFKFGCSTHLSGFGFGGAFGLPGFHWSKNYSCYTYSVEQPNHGTIKVNITCPCCKNNVKLKVPSYKKGEQKQTTYFVFGILIIIIVIINLTFDYDKREIDGLIIKIWGTIIGSIMAFILIRNALTNFFYFMPKLKKDFTFRFMRHKLFY